VSGLVALHGGGEYATGDEAAMDALLAAALEAAGGATPRVVIVPTAVARHRPDLAVAHGERAFRAAAARAGAEVRVSSASLLRRADAEIPGAAVLAELAEAHLVHLPGGDPDLIPAVLRGTAGWAAILRAHAAGGCVAGASAGAMALAERLWTPHGPAQGLGLVPGIAVLPHYAPGRLDVWRAAVDGVGNGGLGEAGALAWLGLDEQTLVIGRPGGGWTVAGRGRAYLVPAGTPAATRSAGPGEALVLG
jgi:cyanophycinase-like exopeptidase